MPNDDLTERRRKARRRNKRQGGIYGGDPLVPIDGKRLLAAIDWRGLAVNAVARAVGEAQSTLNSIVNGEVERCRRARRTKLARVLRVPGEWLGGQGDLPDVPGYQVHRMVNAHRQLDGSWSDAYYVKVPGESGVRLFDEQPALPPRVQLEARDAIQVLRLLFDPDSPFPSAWNRPRAWNVSPDYKSPEALALRDLDALPDDVLAMLMLERWRELLFGAQRRDWHATPDESDEFAKALGTILRLMLSPAIENKANFDVMARRSSLEAQRWVERCLASRQPR
jgi:hypothetical protein